MASLSPPFILCPLAESKKLVGMGGAGGNSSSEERHSIILTLDKNIAIQYHVPEQKQEFSWTSSRHWLTSPVVFCPEVGKYGAIMDNNMVGLWEKEDPHLTSLQKYKFQEQIHELRPTAGLGTLVIFKNGVIRPLTQVMTMDRNSPLMDPAMDPSMQTLIDVQIHEDQNRILLLTTDKIEKVCRVASEKIKSLTVTCLQITQDASGGLDSTSTFSTGKSSVCRVSPPENETILGFCTIKSSEGDPLLMFICSDGYMYRRGVTSESKLAKVTSIAKYMCPELPVVMSLIGDSVIGIYGCDPSEEGSLVLLYDTHYDLILSRQSLKLYGSPAIMVQVGSHLLIPIGLHLLVLRVRKSKAVLASMIGQHQLSSTEWFESRDPWVKDWSGGNNSCWELNHEEKDSNDLELNLKERQSSELNGIFSLVKTLENHGQPQSVICTQIIPQLLESRNINGIEWTLKYFHDIPETYLTHLVVFLLSTVQKIHESTIISSSPDLPQYNPCPQLDMILSRPFQPKVMISALRGMDFEVAKKFLTYLISRLHSTWDDLFDLDSNPQSADLNGSESNGPTLKFSGLLNWTFVLLDAHYPQFVFKNEVGLVESFLDFIQDKAQVLEGIESLEPFLTLTLAKTSFEIGPSPSSNFRSESLLLQ